MSQNCRSSRLINKKQLKKLISIALGLAVIALGLTIIIFCITLFASYSTGSEAKGAESAIKALAVAETEAARPEQSVLAVDDELPLVIQNCTGCHSAKLIAQNRATREGWKNIIVWMQETQNLWDLGTNETKILDYLARHYSPEKSGRRKNLQNIEWYDLKESGKVGN